MNSPTIFCILLALYCMVDGQLNICEPVNSSKRRCIPINDCHSLFAILNNPKRTQKDIDLLKSSHCGFKGNTPAVCCPWTSGDKCYTPEGKLGKCVGLKSCRNLQRLLLPPLEIKKTQYVERSKCDGFDQYSVCCGPDPDFNSVQKGRCALKVSAFPPDPATQCCGVDSGLKNKIYGGNPSAIDQYPWLALIEYEKDGNIKTLCGGALISGRYVLTTATCAHGSILKYGTPETIRLGEYDTSSEGPDCAQASTGGVDCTEGVTRIPIQELIPHPQHVPTLLNHDIALIRMTQVAPFTEFIRPICLPRVNVTRKGTPFITTMAGWGKVSDEIRSSPVKMHVELPFVDKAKCQRVYKVPGRSIDLLKSQICAGGEKNKDSCTGDSGGPLMYENDGTYEIIGIASFGSFPCGTENMPGVYTNVYEYNPWIRSNIVP